MLESLSISDSFFERELIIAGATHIELSVFLKACEKNCAHIHLQRRMATSLLMRILPIPKPIEFVVTLCNQRIVNFLQSIDRFLIAKVFVVHEVDFENVINILINSNSPVNENEFNLNSDFFIYGFDFDVQDEHNPVVEIYSYSTIPNALKLFFNEL